PLSFFTFPSLSLLDLSLPPQRSSDLRDHLLCPPPSPGHPHQHSFPTRRSSDLRGHALRPAPTPGEAREQAARARAREHGGDRARDRKSTRLNSSHQIISYAVFCLKKKKKKRKHTTQITRTNKHNVNLAHTDTDI